MALTTSAVLQALHITLSAKHASSRRAAASSISAALRPSTAPVPHHSSIQRRQSPYTVVEASQAGGAPHGSGAAVNVGGGNPWETVVAALDKRQPEVAWREFMQLLEQGLAPPSNVCDRLIYGESRRIPHPTRLGQAYNRRRPRAAAYMSCAYAVTVLHRHASLLQPCAAVRGSRKLGVCTQPQAPPATC